MGAREPLEMPAPTVVLQAIEQWRSLDLRRMSQRQVQSEMSMLREIIGPSLLQTRHSSSARYFRVRKCKEGESFERIPDLWEPPSERARLGRCNSAGLPVLYCSRNAATALYECHAAPGDEVLVIEYRADALRLAHVVGDYDVRDASGVQLLSESGLLAYRILREFLRAEFTKPVGTGTEFLYHISNAICQIWRQSEDIAGWIYPSVYSPLDENVALIPERARASMSVRKAIRGTIADADSPAREVHGVVIAGGIRVNVSRECQVNEGEVVWRDAAPGSLNVYVRTLV